MKDPNRLLGTRDIWKRRLGSRQGGPEISGLCFRAEGWITSRADPGTVPESVIE